MDNSTKSILVLAVGEFILEIVVICLAWAWYGWKMALVLFLLMWAQNIHAALKTKR